MPAAIYADFGVGVLRTLGVQTYFPDSESVNAALRSVIELAKHLPGGERYRQKGKSARQGTE